MNFNANAGQRQPLGRKIKRVSDVNVMGAPAPTPISQPYNPYSPQYAQNVDFQPQQPNYEYPSTPFQNQQQVQQPQMPPQQNQSFQTPSNQFLMQNQQQSQSSLFAQPVVQDMAMQYGQQLANQGKHLVKSEIEKYVPVTKLKYYFAVDTKYVLSKLKLLIFPFTHNDWSVKYAQDNPVQPRYEVNAPDLYIPLMGYVTYVLIAGLMLGMQKRFSPEQIGIQASSALAWNIVEIAIYTATLYIANINTTLKTFDLLAYSGYKYLGIILSVLFSIIFERMGYYLMLIYFSLALAFFLVRTLKAQVLSETTPAAQDSYYGHQATSTHGAKRRLYFLLFVAGTQPILSWWLTFHLVSSAASKDLPA